MFKNIAIIGASGAIGQAFVEKYINDNNVENIYAFSRKQLEFASNKVESYFIDIEDENSISEAASIAFAKYNIDLILVTTGILHESDVMPEKALKNLSMQNFEKIFKINSFGPALVMKYFLAKISRDQKTVFAAISARVGSISDNMIGGWYTYRASKSALNMFIKTTSIEIARKYKEAVIVGLHPGTVDSPLSKPFQNNVSSDHLFSPQHSVNQLAQVLDKLEPSDTGKCFAYDGEEILP